MEKDQQKIRTLLIILFVAILGLILEFRFYDVIGKFLNFYNFE